MSVSVPRRVLFFMFYILSHLSFHTFPVQFHWGFSSPFKLNTGLKTFLSLPTAQKFKNPCPFSPSHYTTDIFTAVVAAGHTFDFPFTPLNCSSFNVEHNSWYPFSNSSSGLCVFTYLHCSHCFVLVKAKASIEITVGRNHVKHRAFAYNCPLVHAYNFVLRCSNTTYNFYSAVLY